MDYSGSVPNGRPAATSDPNPRTSEASPPAPGSSTTSNPPVTSSSSKINHHTPPPISTTTTPPPPVLSTTKEIATSTPVPIVTVTTSGTVVRTFTSTSYSSYITHVATAIPSQGGGGGSGSTNVGAIAGGVVGGVAAIALIGFIVILLSRRRRSKNKKEASYESETGGAGGPINPHPFANDYNTYGTPTVISDTNSLPSSRPLSMSTAPSQGIKPRPFVQAYNPAYDDQQYAGYDGSQSPPQEHYYNDYNQAYNNNYNTNAYSHDAYYAHQQEPMIPISTSTATGLSSTNNNPPHGRNVPDENDYDLTRKVSRHVPDEIN
ncbi:hypothetical protein V8B55DRAFT_1502171 [Mucor lusitanicus]